MKPSPAVNAEMVCILDSVQSILSVVLSNGNNPTKIIPHLGDCFDGIKSVEFIIENENVANKIKPMPFLELFINKFSTQFLDLVEKILN